VLQLTLEQSAKIVRIETYRRNAETSQTTNIRLMDYRNRHRYLTRSTKVAYHIAANSLISDKVLNVQP
jgi:hypothetical protein